MAYMGLAFSAVTCSSTFRAVRLVQLVCCLGAAVSLACHMGPGRPTWTYLPMLILLLAVMYDLSWKVMSARTTVKSLAPYGSNPRAAAGTLVLVHDAVVCIFFTLSAALLLTHALAQQEPIILGSMACHGSVCAHSGSPNVYMVRDPPTSISSAWTALFATLVMNALLSTVSTAMLAVWSVSASTSSDATHAFIAAGTPCPVHTLVATV